MSWLDLLAGFALGVVGGARTPGFFPALLGGFLVAAGGGVIRDAAYGMPFFLLEHPSFALVALLGALVGFALSKMSPSTRLLVLMDLAASLHFAQAGASRALTHGLTAGEAAVAGVITALGGGAVLLFLGLEEGTGRRGPNREDGGSELSP